MMRIFVPLSRRSAQAQIDSSLASVSALRLLHNTARSSSVHRKRIVTFLSKEREREDSTHNCLPTPLENVSAFGKIGPSPQK